MEPADLTIRTAAAVDLDAVSAIYGHAVHTGIATFDLDDPPRDYWQGKLDSDAVGDHVLVAERDGAVLGFAYSGAFRPRPAYAATRETSVYLAPDAVGNRIGTALYAELLDRLRADAVHAAVAVIALPNPASVALHERLGYRRVGVLREVGHKFGRWVDVAWYQRLLT